VYLFDNSIKKTSPETSFSNSWFTADIERIQRIPCHKCVFVILNEEPAIDSDDPVIQVYPVDKMDPRFFIRFNGH